MPEYLSDVPYVWVFLFFWCGALARSNAMYWVGRALAAGTSRTRWARLLSTPAYARAEAFAERWGVWAVPFSFLTVGLQSLVQVSAGVTRVPTGRYLVATAVGSLAWAGIYTTIGMAVLLAWVKAGALWGLLALGAVVALVVLVRRRRASRTDTPDGPW